MATQIPLQLRLDNAANIYPASKSKKYSSQYRMAVTLTEAVDPGILQSALERVCERIPTFRCRLKTGFFWWFLKQSDAKPEILPLKPLRQLNFMDQKGFLYRVSINGRQIVLDMFHALADGNGALVFLSTLVGEYIHQRYGASIDYNSLVLNPGEAPRYDEVEDSFKRVFSGQTGELEKNDDAWHMRGRALPKGGVQDMRLVMNMDAVLQNCWEHHCTVTELLTACVLSALQQVHRQDHRRGKKTVLKVSVPVNLRPIYNSRTLRNFASYVHLGVDVESRYPGFPELVRIVRQQKAQELSKDRLEPKIAKNVQLEESALVKALPLFIKHPVIDIINRLHGDRFCSQTLSNLGLVHFPAAMQPYITDIDFSLGRQRGNSGACSCIGYGDKLYFHITRKILPDNFEQAFIRQVEALHIPLESSTSTLA